MTPIEKLLFLVSVIFKWNLTKVIDANTKKAKEPINIVFCLVDHYEPGTGNVAKEIEIGRVDELMEKYPIIADKHSDFYGNRPKRTWFFPPHYHRYYNLKKIVKLCEMGYGEIELHLHHGKMRPDTSENLKKTILRCIHEYKKFGIFGEQDGKKMYGFIHGDWALDNSRGNKFCGVNNELTILRETGCYCDFTFPSLNESNPSFINTIYYAIDDQEKPKSYDKGVRVKKNGNETGEIMLLQGPVYPFSSNNKILGTRIFGDAINGVPPTNKRMIDSWIKANICVQGESNIIFVKTHTHGATDSKAVLGKEMDFIFDYLETHYNDGDNYILNYVTAREMYNIVKAIEVGENIKNVDKFRDYLIGKPNYDSTVDIDGATRDLISFVSKTYQG